MPPKPVYVRRAFDYDRFFGHTLMCVTGEPVTPTKVAIFYLIRTLFHAHFGRRAVPSLNPFTKQEKTRAFSVLYGLVLSRVEIPYHDFRRCVRILNEDIGHNIFYHFVSSMEKLARGDELIDMLFENSFYTSKRSPHEKIVRKEPDPDAEELTFMSSKSYLYIWMKRVMLQYTRTPQRELFVISEQMKKWLVGENPLKISRFGLSAPLPYDIDCSVRARLWLLEQLRLVQFCPSQAMSYEKILDWCELISQRHLDVFNVHLLRAVVHVQLQNPPDAIKSLKTFFDLSMLQFTEDATNALDTLRLMAPCQIALRYGPILQGRVHRLFGDYESASFLFKESIQQAQLNHDDMCNRMANLEVTINEILTNGPLLERPYSERKSLSQTENVERRVIQDTHHSQADMDRPNERMLANYADEAYEIHTFQISLTKLMLCLEDMMDGKYLKPNHTADYVFMGLNRLRQIYDVQNKSRMVEDYSNAIMSSALINNGMYNQARRVTETEMVNNCEAPCIPKLETECQAVSGVNLVYSLAAVGEYEKAFQTLSILEATFPADLNWMGARHVEICSQIVNFEKDFLLNRFTACFGHISGLESTAPLEFVLRKSLLLAVTGKTSEAVGILKRFKCGDVRGNLRIQMQLATIHTASGFLEHTAQHIEEAFKIAVNVHFRDANLLVTRRAASMFLAQKKWKSAEKVLCQLNKKVENFGSFIEKAIYYASYARCLRLLGEDPREMLKKCKAAVTGNRWPAMNKLVLTELALLHATGGLFPDENKATWAKERFGRLESEFPGPCTWIFI